MSPRTAKHMTWHQSHDAVDGVMVHPSDGEAWKQFNGCRTCMASRQIFHFNLNVSIWQI